MERQKPQYTKVENDNPDLRKKTSGLKQAKMLAGLASMALILSCSEDQMASSPTQALPPKTESVPTATVQPELMPMLERINVGIPGLIVEKYPLEITNVTSTLDQKIKDKLQEAMEHKIGLGTIKDEGFEYNYDLCRVPCKLQYKKDDGFKFKYSLDHNTANAAIIDVFYREKGKLKKGPTAYYDSKVDKYYSWETGEQSPRMQNFPDIMDAPFHKPTVTDSGRVLYGTTRYSDSVGGGALVLIDINEKTKTIIKSDNWWPNFALSGNGKKLLFEYTTPEVAKFVGESVQRGLFPSSSRMERYLIDIDAWQVVYHDNTMENSTLSYDGNKIYFESDEFPTPGIEGKVLDTITKKETTITWPVDRIVSGAVGNSDFSFLATNGLFYRSICDVVAPHHGCEISNTPIVVRTSSGMYLIASGEYELSPRNIYDDGTLVTTRGDVFKFENGTYKLVETNADNPLHEPLITDLGK